MCSPTTSCSGSCDQCALSSSAHLEARPSPAIAWTAFRIFVLPLLTALMAASWIPHTLWLQLPLGFLAFCLTAALTRLLPGGRLL